MSRNHISYISLVAVLGMTVLGCAVDAEAQRDYQPLSGPVTSQYDRMNAVKRDIAEMIKINKGLEARYAELLKQWQQMPKQNIPVSMAVREARQQNLFTPEPKLGNLVPDKMKSVQGQPIIQGPQDNSEKLLRQKLLKANEQKALLELQLSDLQYHRRELELELKLKNVERKDRSNAIQRQTESLKLQVQEALQTEKELLYEISKREGLSKIAPDKIPELEAENTQLKKMTEELSKQAEFLEREVAILRDKKKLKEQSGEELISQIENEKIRLRSEVHHMVNEHDQLTDTVATSLSRQERKKKLLEEIIFYDRENQKLQAKIQQLTDQINYFEF